MPMSPDAVMGLVVVGLIFLGGAVAGYLVGLSMRSNVTTHKHRHEHWHEAPEASEEDDDPADRWKQGRIDETD